MPTVVGSHRDSSVAKVSLSESLPEEEEEEEVRSSNGGGMINIICVFCHDCLLPSLI